MYTSSSLSPLLLSLPEALDSSPFLPAKQSSSDSIPSCNMYFARSAENCLRRDACSGDGAGAGGVSSLHTGFSVIGVFHFCRVYNLIWKLLTIEPKRHKFTIRISDLSGSTRVSLYKPAIRAMLVLVTLTVSSSGVLFTLSRSGRID